MNGGATSSWMAAAKEARGLSRSVRHKLLTPARFQPRLKGSGGTDLDSHHTKLLLQSLLIEERGENLQMVLQVGLPLKNMQSHFTLLNYILSCFSWAGQRVKCLKILPSFSLFFFQKGGPFMLSLLHSPFWKTAHFWQMNTDERYRQEVARWWPNLSAGLKKKTLHKGWWDLFPG